LAAAEARVKIECDSVHYVAGGARGTRREIGALRCGFGTVLQDELWEGGGQGQPAASRATHKANSVVVVTIVDTDEEDASSCAASCSPREPERSTPEHSISEVTVISVQTSPAHLEYSLTHPLVSNSSNSCESIDSMESSEMTSENISQDGENLFFDRNVDVSSSQDNYNHDRATEDQEDLQTNPFIYKINHPLGVKNYVIKLKEHAARGRLFRNNDVERVTVNTTQNVCNYEEVRSLLTSYGVISPIDYSRKGSGDELASKEDCENQTMIVDVSDVEMEEEEPIYGAQEIRLDTEANETSVGCIDPEMEDCNDSVVRIESSSNYQTREEMAEKDTEPLKRRSKRINKLNGEKKQKCSEAGPARTRVHQPAGGGVREAARRGGAVAGAGARRGPWRRAPLAPPASPQIRAETWPYPTANKSVQDIYIESRLYKFFDNEMSKIFLKNGTSRYSNSKFREYMATLRSSQTSQTNLMNYFYPQGSLLESLQNCLQKGEEILTFSSQGQGSVFTAKNANNVCKSSKSTIASGEVHNQPCNTRVAHISPECNSNMLQHSSSLNERKCEVLEKLSKFIEENCMDLHESNSFSTHGTPVMDQNQRKFEVTSVNQWNRSSSNLYGKAPKAPLNGLDSLDNKDNESVPATTNVYFKSNSLYRSHVIDSRTILDSLCCVLYSIARDYCKINNLKTDELVNYINSLTPQLLMEWIEKNIEYESERL
ncbi:Protein of unknown function, partial [Gryllus bimaculatus]